MHADACLFCRPRDPAAILFETDSLCVMPDDFLLLPGHILIIPKQHLRCYAAGTPELWRELDEVAARVRRFLDDAYGAAVGTSETGVTGQTVSHAHLHLLPIGLEAVPAEIAAHPDLQPMDDWADVAARFAEHGEYYYVEIGGQRCVASSYSSPPIQAMRHAIAEVAGLTLDGHRFERAAGDQGVVELRRRWHAWVSAPR